MVWSRLGLELVELGTVVWPGMVLPVLVRLQLVGPVLDMVGLDRRRWERLPDGELVSR